MPSDPRRSKDGRLAPGTGAPELRGGRRGQATGDKSPGGLGGGWGQAARPPQDLLRHEQAAEPFGLRAGGGAGGWRRRKGKHQEPEGRPGPIVPGLQGSRAPGLQGGSGPGADSFPGASRRSGSAMCSRLGGWRIGARTAGACRGRAHARTPLALRPAGDPEQAGGRRPPGIEAGGLAGAAGRQAGRPAGAAGPELEATPPERACVRRAMRTLRPRRRRAPRSGAGPHRAALQPARSPPP